MMKKIIYITSFFLLIACNSSSKKDVSKTEIGETLRIDNIGVDNSNFELNGTWGLTNYFDTIVENKELAKYRLQTPTWFAILLEIENDSLKCFGSIENSEYKINKLNDTVITLNSNVTGDEWNLILSKPYLKLVQNPNAERIDSTKYIFRKREDLYYFSIKNKDFWVIGDDVTEYFNDKLFKGKYQNLKTHKEVIFGDNGKLIGIDGFDTYEVRNYFGTLHMHKNLDVITFKNINNKEYKQYNWVFSGDEILLTEFVYEKVTYNGETSDGDYLILGKEKIKLKKY